MISPSGLYQSDVTNYKVKDQINRNTNCMITQISNDKIIAIIDKPSPEFQDFLWYTKNGDEWLQFGQTFVHLNSGLVYDKPDNDFHWIKTYISPKADIIAVTNLRQFKFFDISNVSKDWPELKLNLIDYCAYTYKNKCEWDDHNTFIIKDLNSIRTFRRNDTEMVNIKVVKFVVSPK